MYLDIDGKNVMHTFDSVSEYLAYAIDTPSEFYHKDRHSRNSSIIGQHDFFGSTSIEEAQELAYKGYPQAREHGEPIRNLAIEMLSPHIIKPKPQYDMVGDIIDVSRYLSGIPDDFIIRREPVYGLTERGKSSKVFRICVNLTYVCYTSGNEIARRGAAIVSLIDLLEQQGRRVEVTGIMAVRAQYNSSSKEVLHNIITIKEAGHALDIDFLYFVLAHPSMLRRFGFSVWETYPKAVAEFYGVPHGNYGTVAAPDQMVDSDIYFSNLLDRTPFTTATSSVIWVMEHLVKQGAIDASVLETFKAEHKPAIPQYQPRRRRY